MSCKDCYTCRYNKKEDCLSPRLYWHYVDDSNSPGINHSITKWLRDSSWTLDNNSVPVNAWYDCPGWEEVTQE